MWIPPVMYRGLDTFLVTFLVMPIIPRLVSRLRSTPIARDPERRLHQDQLRNRFTHLADRK